MSLISQNGTSQSTPSIEGESALENLIEECTNRLQAGEAIDVDELARLHPEYADRIRRLLPSLEMMAEVGRTSIRPLEAEFHTTVALNPPQSGPFELGDYHVHQIIGRGGMGIVYEAIQISLNRRVALKVLPFAAALDPHHLRRFQTEAQAAAQLHHTNIVPVFSVGCERGIHFYAMQFIEGRTLAALIQERRDLTGAIPGPSRPASDREYVRSVARLGIQAAEALDYAHRQGIIHRDIKPANLLVDLHGNLWITDFGLARFLNETGLTLTGDLIGTLRYMSPEQALGKRLILDHRTDIYSLGSTLYELLTLHPVVDGRDRQEVLRRIAQDEPIPPRRIDPAIPRDLETLLLKTLSREPEDRYATAQEFADDLRRFLEHRPINARRPHVMELAGKWMRRHVIVVAAAFLILLLALCGLATGLILIGREQVATQAALTRALTETRRANENSIWFINGITEPLKRMANPDLAKNPDYVTLRRHILAEAINAFEGFLLTQVESPEKKGEAFNTWIHIALLHTVADDHPKAQDAYRKAIALAEDWRNDDPNWRAWYHIGQAHSHLGMELWDVGETAASAPHFRRAADAFRRAVEQDPTDILALQSSAWFLNLFQDPSYRDPQLAVQLARRLVTLTSEREHNRQSYSFGYRPLFTLGLAEYRMGNLDAASKALERSNKLRGGGDAYEWFVLAMVVARQGDMARARQLHAQAARWMRVYRYSDFELHFLDSEAAALLHPLNPSIPPTGSRAIPGKREGT